MNFNVFKLIILYVYFSCSIKHAILSNLLTPKLIIEELI